MFAPASCVRRRVQILDGEMKRTLESLRLIRFSSLLSLAVRKWGRELTLEQKLNRLAHEVEATLVKERGSLQIQVLPLFWHSRQQSPLYSLLLKFMQIGWRFHPKSKPAPHLGVSAVSDTTAKFRRK